MTRNALLAVALSISAAVASAETAYVTDSLRLGLHASADTSDRPFENLLSGTELEVLERTALYARVKTPGGREGWVKSAYLVEQKPAALRVAELEAELASVRSEFTTARSAHLRAEDEVSRLGKQMTTTTGSADAVQATLARLQRDNADYEARLESYRGSLPLLWVAAALGLSLIAGFALGWWWLDALIRRRHGGFRIY